MYLLTACEILIIIESLGMNSPRFPPVGRLPSYDSQNMIYNQLHPNYYDDRNYQESQLASRSNPSKPILPPLESNGRKPSKPIAAKNCKKTIA